MKTRNEIVNEIFKNSTKLDNEVNDSIKQSLINSKWKVENFKKITVTRIKGDPLSTATGKGLHNAVFSTRGREALLNVRTKDDERINIHLQF